jgi:outer membrane protein assembly factor BamB
VNACPLPLLDRRNPVTENRVSQDKMLDLPQTPAATRTLRKASLMSIARLLLVAAAFLVQTAAQQITVQADNWPSWRGPHNNGVCEEKNLPTEFSHSKNVLWRLPLPGQAGATPVVWGDHIFLTAPDGDELQLLCISTDGRELWRRTVGQGNKNARVDEGNSCSPSPITDGKHVWTLMGSGDLACFDFNGVPAWSLNLQKRYGKFRISYGMSSTPVLDGDRIYCQLIHGDGDASTHEAIVFALDAQTGKEIWKQSRISDARVECEHSYASPMMYDDGKLKFLLSHGADYIVAHRLEDGSEIWRCGGLNPKEHYNPTLRLVASPATAPGIIVVPSAKNGPVVALRPGGKGDVTASKEFIIWKRPRNTPDVPSPMIHDGLVYLCREGGDVLCLDAKTGEEIYHKQTKRGKYRASPVCADGKLYITSRDGEVTVAKAGKEFEILAKNELGEQIAASPAISNGRIYFRTFEALWAIGTP